MFTSDVLKANNVSSLSEDTIIDMIIKPNNESYLYNLLEFNADMHRIEIADKISYYRQLIGQDKGILNEEAITESRVIDMIKLITSTIERIISWIKNAINSLFGVSKRTKENFMKEKSNHHFDLDFNEKEFEEYFNTAWQNNIIDTSSGSKSEIKDKMLAEAKERFNNAEEKEFTFNILQYTDPSYISDSSYVDALGDISSDIDSIVTGNEISDVSSDMLADAYRVLADKIRRNSDQVVNNYTDPVINDTTFRKFITSNIVYSYSKKMTYSEWKNSVANAIVPPDPNRTKRNSNAIINLCADIKAKAERYADEIPVSQKNNIKQLLSYVSSISSSFTWYITYVYNKVNENCTSISNIYRRIKRSLYGFSKINESTAMHGEPFDSESIWKDVDLKDFAPSEWLDLELTTECFDIEFELVEHANRVALSEAIILNDGNPIKYNRLVAMREAEEKNLANTLKAIAENISKIIKKFLDDLTGKTAPIGKWVARNKELVAKPIKSGAKSTGNVLAGMYRVQDPIKFTPFNYETMKDELEQGKEAFFQKYIMNTLNSDNQFSKRDYKWQNDMSVSEWCKAYYGSSVPEDKSPKCEYTAQELERNKDNIVNFISNTRYMNNVNNDMKQLESQIRTFESKAKVSNNAQQQNTTENKPAEENKQGEAAKNEGYYSMLYGTTFLNEVEIVKSEEDKNEDNNQNGETTNEAANEAAAFRKYIECYKDVIFAKQTAAMFIVNEFSQVIDNHIKSYMSNDQKKTEADMREKENPGERKNNPA